MENISSEQELKELLEEGKITEEEYQELAKALRQQGHRFHPNENNTTIDTQQTESWDSFPFESIPWQIWIITGFLGLAGIGNILAITHNPIAIIWFLTNVVLVIGLLGGCKWAFALFQLIAGIHVLYFGMDGAFLFSFLNLFMMILAFSAWRHFFPIKTAY